MHRFDIEQLEPSLLAPVAEFADVPEASAPGVRVADESRAPGLGADFIRQIERTLAEVAAHPGAGSSISGAVIKMMAHPEISVRDRLTSAGPKMCCRHRDHASTPMARLLEMSPLTMQTRR